MSVLLYTENILWLRQEKARKNNQNFMKVTPEQIKLLLMTILAERNRCELLKEQTRKALHLTTIPDADRLAESYLADWDALHQTMDEDYAEISELRVEVMNLRQEINELEPDDRDDMEQEQRGIR